MQILDNVYIDGYIQATIFDPYSNIADPVLALSNGKITQRSLSELLSDLGINSSSGYVPYTNALASVDLGGYDLSAKTINSTVTTGTSPFTVVSSTEVANLNSQYLGGFEVYKANHAWAYVPVVATGGGMEIGSYIDFHETSGATTDFDSRIISSSQEIYFARNSIATNYKIHHNLNFPVSLTSPVVNQLLQFDGSNWVNISLATISLDSFTNNGIYVRADGTVPFTNPQAGIFPTASNHLATKEYVDNAISFIQDFYFDNTLSDVGGIYYSMQETPVAGPTYNFTSAALSPGNDQPLVNFITNVNIPGISLLNNGVYNAVIHASADTATAGKYAQIYFELYTRDTGGTETLIGTSITSPALTTSIQHYEITFVTENEISINTTDRLVVKFYANIVGATGTTIAVTLAVDDATASRLSIPTTVEAVATGFVRRDGTSSLTGNWNAGAFDITANNFIANQYITSGALAGTGTRSVVVDSTGQLQIGYTQSQNVRNYYCSSWSEVQAAITDINTNYNGGNIYLSGTITQPAPVSLDLTNINFYGFNALWTFLPQNGVTDGSTANTITITAGSPTFSNIRFSGSLNGQISQTFSTYTSRTLFNITATAFNITFDNCGFADVVGGTGTNPVIEVSNVADSTVSTIIFKGCSVGSHNGSTNFTYVGFAVIRTDTVGTRDTFLVKVYNQQTESGSNAVNETDTAYYIGANGNTNTYFISDSTAWVNHQDAGSQENTLTIPTLMTSAANDDMLIFSDTSDFKNVKTITVGDLVGSNMVYPGAGIPISTGTAWGTSIPNYSSNWNDAYTFTNGFATNYSKLVAIQNLADTAGLLRNDGSGNFSYDTHTYLTGYTETDPIVGAINGIVKADGAGNISAAVPGTDYQAPLTPGTDYDNYNHWALYVDGYSKLSVTSGATFNLISGSNVSLSYSANGVTINSSYVDTTYGVATSSTLGLVQIGYTTTGKDYAVQLNASNQMFVNVPWTDTNTTYSVATSSVLGLVKIGYTLSGKNYPVQLNTSDQMYVNVPWTDTVYSLPLAASGTRGGVQIGYTQTGKNYPVQLSSEKMYVSVPWTDTTYSVFTSSANGLVPTPGVAGSTKFLRQDGTWVVPTDTNTTYAQATSTTLGLVKIGFTTSGKNYAVQLSSGQMYVNVPWTDTVYSLPLAASGTRGGVQIGYSQNGKNYPVLLSSEKMYVNVPWTDTNTTYSVFTSSADGLVPTPNEVGATKFLREDGTWVVPSGSGGTPTLQQVTDAGATTTDNFTLASADGSLYFGDITTGGGATDAGILMDGNSSYRGGMFTEVNGAILSYGVNINQITTPITTYSGGIFRIDTRTGTAGINPNAHAFIIYRRAENSSTQYSAFIIDLNSGATELAPSGGNVGIYNPNPSQRLDVNGYVRANGFIVSSNPSTLNFLKSDGSVDTTQYLPITQGIPAFVTGNSTPTTANNGKLLIFSTSTNHTVTLNDILSTGDSIDFMQYGTGTITFQAGSGVTLIYESTLVTRGVGAFVTAKKIAGATWALVGGLL